MPDGITVGLMTHAGGAHVGAYLAALAQTEEVTSVVLSDPDGTWAEQARTTLKDKLTGSFRDHREMLRNEPPQMALVTMEAVLAPPVIEAALDAGCHVFAEKPACVRADDFAKLKTLADSKHLHLMLAFANRLNPPVLAARDLIRSGALGTLYGLEMHLVADQTRLTRPGYHKTWFADRARSGGGHLAWLGIHWLDLAVYLSGSHVAQVTGFAGNVGGQPIAIEDSAALAMRFDNGTFGTLTSGYYLDRGYHSHIKIWGSLGWLLLEPSNPVPLQWSSRKDGNTEPRAYDGPTSPSGYTPFVQAAVKAVAGKGEPPVTGEDGLHALKVVFGLYEAAETGRTISI